MNRKTLFRKGRPLLRAFVSHENGELGADVGILWAAYKRGSFRFVDMNEVQFTEFILQRLTAYASVWFMEDDNRGFRSGRGPVCAVTIHFNGWKILPEVYWFSWATLKNKLRCSVAFIQKSRYDKTVGCCELRTGPDGAKLMKHLPRYIPTLRYVGKVWFGTPVGDQYIYSIKGAKHAGADGDRKNADGVQRNDHNGHRRADRSEERESNLPRENSESVEERSGDS
jgi:hypothetical protein